MRSVCFKAVALGALASFLFAGLAVAASPKAPTVGARAYMGDADRTLVVAGKTPRCEFGRAVAIEVQVRQAGRFAKGSWKARCVGPRLTWHVELRPKVGRFTAGRARVVAVSSVSRKGKTVAKRRVTRRVRLKVGRGSPLGDYWISAGITVTAPPGVTVWIRGGGTGTFGSNCTRDETQTSVTPEGESKRVVVGYNAKDSGSCALEDSWSNFKVWLYGKGRSEAAYFYLGQHSGLLGSRDFEATCYAGTPHDVETHRLNPWREYMHCKKTADFELNIVVDDR